MDPKKRGALSSGSTSATHRSLDCDVFKSSISGWASAHRVGTGFLKSEFQTIVKCGFLVQVRSFADSLRAFALNDNGAEALDKSPPSIVIPWLAAPSTCRKTAVGVNTREALSNTSLVSMNRSKDSAFRYLAR